MKIITTKNTRKFSKIARDGAVIYVILDGCLSKDVYCVCVFFREKDEKKMRTYCN